MKSLILMYISGALVKESQNSRKRRKQRKTAKEAAEAEMEIVWFNF